LPTATGFPITNLATEKLLGTGHNKNEYISAGNKLNTTQSRVEIFQKGAKNLRFTVGAIKFYSCDVRERQHN
jgi:hypothetical protein